jgi:Zn-dependent peptidase ImmA (M78 family)
MYDPYQHAAELGITVLHRPLRTAHEMWLPDHNIIVIHDRLRRVHDRTALAHGIAHAVLGHPDDRPKHEVQADRYAANRLISEDEAVAVMQWCDDSARIAAELGVTGRIWRVWYNSWRQQGGHLGEGVA